MEKYLFHKTVTLIEKADELRKCAKKNLNSDLQNQFSQFMTSAPIASFMASLIPQPKERKIIFLDPGAGMGILTSAFVQCLNSNASNYEMCIEAYEIDNNMISYLEQNLELCKKLSNQKGNKLTWKVYCEDFIIDVPQKIIYSETFWHKQINKFTHCIMNPPYKKIHTESKYRKFLRAVGIETVNLYSAFVSLSLALMQKNGYLVAIIPRSFCSGPYYKSFREFILKNSALRHIHLFNARNKAFKDDNVLQENIIIMLQKDCKQNDVTISISTDDKFDDIATYVYSFEQIVKKDDPSLFIHIPIPSEKYKLNNIESLKHSLDDIGIQVSTGPIVDFRHKDNLKSIFIKDTVPLLYPSHFSRQTTRWPIENNK